MRARVVVTMQLRAFVWRVCIPDLDCVARCPGWCVWAFRACWFGCWMESIAAAIPLLAVSPKTTLLCSGAACCWATPCSKTGTSLCVWRCGCVCDCVCLGLTDCMVRCHT